MMQRKRLPNPHTKSDLHQGLYVAPHFFSTAATFKITHFFDILVHLFGLQPHVIFSLYKYYSYFSFVSLFRAVFLPVSLLRSLPH